MIVSTPPTKSSVGRFAPTASGLAHPGTLLAALLCWLDARSRGGQVVLRLENLDPERCRREHLAAMVDALAWLGLDWDAVIHQSDCAPVHEAALDQLAARDLLYPCSCSRSDLRALGQRTRDGTFRYPGTCRSRTLPAAADGGWRGVAEPLRVRLPEGTISLRDESGPDLSADPLLDTGDPIVRRRDGAIAYHLASVVDDHAIGVTRVVRGRDLAPSTALQVVLQRLLELPSPVYRHHLLLLEQRGDKLAKLHGSIDVEALRAVYDGRELCGVLAASVGIRRDTTPISPRELLPGFVWSSVREADRVLHWDGHRLIVE